MSDIKRTIIWHPHSVRPVYVPGGDNRLITCLNLKRLGFRAIKGINISYVDLNPDGSVNNCGDSWHSKKWLKKAAIRWENMNEHTWWTYGRGIVPEEIYF